ncbi:MAG: 2-C-methyl-D-erythritol 2,4-cyclodiphosphate synthase [Bacteroidetes bacterium]|nr:2-C-methyl-D-erythritol 2,4-cyclodiphosphate synthase [Bacteroidota bacterium]
MASRVGIGYDMHQLVAGRPLILGGVQISHPLGLAGHSDADVLLHAICDALLGAAALGDIGVHFPDSDLCWRGADSRILLQKVNDLVSEAGYSVANVDATIIIERPKLQPHIESMRRTIAGDLMITLEQVSIKATTSERLGIIGREEAAAACAVCLLTGPVVS